MALVSGQSPYAELSNACTPADSDDDEYAYVSSLAEQIAHALVLDDDDDNPPAHLSQSSNSFQQELRCREDMAWPSANLRTDKSLKTAEVMCPVSHFAAAWRDNGPTEWDCFYTPSPQRASKQLSNMYTTQLQHRSKHIHLFRGWNSVCLANNKQLAACSRETWDLQSQEAYSAGYIVSSPVRKESVGTGVFLPKIVNSGSHYRRKSGFSSTKSAYAPRHKC